MITFCEASGPMCAWADDRKHIEAQVRERFDVFVSDDIVAYPASFQSDAAPSGTQTSNPGDPVPGVCRQPANEPARSAAVEVATDFPATVAEAPDHLATVAVVPDRAAAILPPPRPLQGSAKRFHQSNSGGQRQMGGVKQTNRFFARRQFA